MKKHLALLLLAITFQGFAQTNLITGINISLPANPDANIAEWSKAMPPLMISAQTRMEYGKVSPMVMESRILVSIKGGGAVCGHYTVDNAPASNFNSPAKVWSGETALNLLGEACVLKPGIYELCVKFYGDGAAGQVLIGEGCKSFTIKETEHKIYQSPQALAPANDMEFSETDLKKPMTFRWTPVIPKPQEPVTYRLKVWQLMQGQTGTQAMRVNQPIITKDVDNMTQAIVNNIIDGSCKPPYLCDFVWNVQALNREGKPIGENNGTSNPSQFSATSCDVNLALKLQSIECLQPTHGFNNYKVCITSTYSSSNTNLTYSGSNGIKAYSPSYTPFYTVSNITPTLHVQNNGAATTVNYCFNVSVPTGQTSIKIGLQGDDKDPGPIVCQPGAELDLRLPDCTNPTCDCGSWSPLTVLDAANGKRYECGSTIEWTCKQALNFTASYQCSPNDKTCVAKTTWKLEKNGILVKSGTGTNQLSDGFSLLENGTYNLTLNASCNGKICPPCTFTIVIKDCIPTCDCGTWSTILINGVKYKCGNETPIKLSCNKPVKFSNTYQCSPNDKTCQAETKWEVTKDGSSFSSGNGSSGTFTPTANGTYTLTTYANCNGKECKPCITTFIVADCDEKPCDCGEWSDFPIKVQTGGAIISRIKCNGSSSLGIGTYSIQYPNFICNPNDKTCLASYSWSVQGPVTGNGTGNLINFNFSLAGTYTITLTPICGNKKCKPCKIVIRIEDPLPCNLSFTDNLKDNYCVGDQVTINWTGAPQPSTVNLVLIDFTNWVVYQTLATNIPNSGSYTLTLPANLPCDPERKWCFYVTDPAQNPQCWNYSKEFTVGCCVDEKPCDCGTWSPLTVLDAAHGKKYDCGSTIEWTCKQALNFSASYQCSPNDKTCEATTTWKVEKAGVIVKSGTGTNQLNDGFSLLENGTYILTLNASCNGKVCPPCTYTIIVSDCIDKPCDCGKWNNSGIKIQKDGAIISNLKCGGDASLGIGTYGIQFSNFICNPSNDNCLVTYSWSVQGPNSGNGTGNIINFNFSQVGTYTVTLTPFCGDKRCEPCKIVIKIEDPLPCSLSFLDNLKDNYCVGDQVTINWTGTPLPSTVNIVLIDFTNWIVYQTLATNIPNSGSYTLTLPPNLPCDPERKWCFYVTDLAQNPQCWNYSKEFTIGCCVDKPCDCGTWSPLSVQNAAGTRRYDCGSTIEWTCKQALNFTANYQCSPNDKTCEATTTWKVEKAGVIVKSGTGTNQLNDGFSLLENGTYILTLNASCNGKVCPPCTFTIVIKDCIDDEPCDPTLNTIMYDSTSFNNSLVSSQLIDFSTNDNGTPMSNPSADFQLSNWIWNGVTFSARSYWNSFIYGNPIIIGLPPGLYKKAGFKMFQFNGLNGDITIKVYAGKCIYTYVHFADASIPQYFGISLPVAIDKIEISHAISPIVIDDFIFGN